MSPDLPLSDRRTDELVRLTIPDPPRPIDLSRLFGNSADVELEIGVGKGRFLLVAASSQPEKNFVGLEYARAYMERSLQRVGKRGLTNVRLAHAEAASFFEHCLADRSLVAVHVYFPDPWPKKRHHKRRLIRPAFVAEVERVLRPGGLLRVATDHPEYALVMREVFAAAGGLESLDPGSIEWNLPGMDEFTGSGLTNFEIKYRREGRPIHRFALRRR